MEEGDVGVGDLGQGLGHAEGEGGVGTAADRQEDAAEGLPALRTGHVGPGPDQHHVAGRLGEERVDHLLYGGVRQRLAAPTQQQQVHLFFSHRLPDPLPDLPRHAHERLHLDPRVAVLGQEEVEGLAGPADLGCGLAQGAALGDGDDVEDDQPSPPVGGQGLGQGQQGPRLLQAHQREEDAVRTGDDGFLCCFFYRSFIIG